MLYISYGNIHVNLSPVVHEHIRLYMQLRTFITLKTISLLNCTYYISFCFQFHVTMHSAEWTKIKVNENSLYLQVFLNDSLNQIMTVKV